MEGIFAKRPRAYTRWGILSEFYGIILTGVTPRIVV